MIKSALVYLFNKSFNVTTEALDESLSEFSFTPCGSQDISKFGFTLPMGKHGELYAQHSSGITVLTTMKQDKILPAQVVIEALGLKVDEIEDNEGRKVTKKEKDALREEIIIGLLPRAFVKSTRMNFYILDLEFGKVIVADTTSPAKAEEGLALIRKALGSLPIIPLRANMTIETVLTSHVRSKTCFDGFAFEGLFDLRSQSDEGGSAKMKDFKADSDEIMLHLENSKVVSKCSMSFGQSVEFRVDENLTFSSIKFSEELKAQNDEIGSEDAQSRFDADLVLSMSEFSRLLELVVSNFGGIEEGV